jgi:prepilin-type N-terminal cleavage/methylation domain-containing protein
MKTCDKKRGFTLIEMMITVAVIVILVSLVVGITKRIYDQNKERLCRNELALIDNALEQFRDFGFDYKNGYAGLNFPLDCNYAFPAGQIPITLRDAFGFSSTGISTVVNPPHDPNYYSSEVLYFCLNQIPDCRTTLDKIDKSLLTNKGGDKVTDITISVNSGPAYPFMRFIDPWGTALSYHYYDTDASWAPVTGTKKTFPVVTSAGPDKQFGTNDDIVNRQGR